MSNYSVDQLFTGELPQTQTGRWDMIRGLMDHLAGKPGQTGIAARVIKDPANGSLALNEGMDRLSSLVNAVKSHPHVPAFSDPARDKVQSLVESNAYLTLATLNLATKPRAGQEHGHILNTALSGSSSERERWQQIPDKLPVQWQDLKQCLEVKPGAIPPPPRLGKISPVPSLSPQCRPLVR